MASTTRTPRLRSSGTSAASTFSIPPYPGGGTESHGPAFIEDGHCHTRAVPVSRPDNPGTDRAWFREIRFCASASSGRAASPRGTPRSCRASTTSSWWPRRTSTPPGPRPSAEQFGAEAVADVAALLTPRAGRRVRVRAPVRPPPRRDLRRGSGGRRGSAAVRGEATGAGPGHRRGDRRPGRRGADPGRPPLALRRARGAGARPARGPDGAARVRDVVGQGASGVVVGAPGPVGRPGGRAGDPRPRPRQGARRRGDRGVGTRSRHGARRRRRRRDHRTAVVRERRRRLAQRRLGARGEAPRGAGDRRGRARGRRRGGLARGARRRRRARALGVRPVDGVRRRGPGVRRRRGGPAGRPRDVSPGLRRGPAQPPAGHAPSRAPPRRVHRRSSRERSRSRAGGRGTGPRRRAPRAGRRRPRRRAHPLHRPVRRHRAQLPHRHEPGADVVVRPGTRPVPQRPARCGLSRGRGWGTWRSPRSPRHRTTSASPSATRSR